MYFGEYSYNGMQFFIENRGQNLVLGILPNFKCISTLVIKENILAYFYLTFQYKNAKAFLKPKREMIASHLIHTLAVLTM